MDLKEKERLNVWDHLKDFIKVFKLMKENKWSWIYNPECKYVELRIDMRNGGCLIKDRRGNRIDPKDLEYQCKSGQNDG